MGTMGGRRSVAAHGVLSGVPLLLIDRHNEGGVLTGTGHIGIR
jgi:hypothetical protein